MTDTLIARLRDATTGNLFADRVEAADRIEYQDKLIEQFGGISKDAMEQCFALTKEVEQLKHLHRITETEWQDRYDALQSRLTALEKQEPVAWAVIGEDGYDPKDGHKQFIGLSIHKPMVFMGSTAAPLFLAAGAAPKPRCELCDYQHGHAIGCDNNPVDIALKLAAPQQAEPKEQP